MENQADNNRKYKILKQFTILLRPYEKGLAVVVRQRDSFCLYTSNPFHIESVLFAAVQIMKEGVVLTHYQPLAEALSDYKLPKALQEFKTGDNRFTFTELSQELKKELQQFISFLSWACKSEKLVSTTYNIDKKKDVQLLS